MPNRIIKESICTSENIDQLSPFCETVFYRLIVNVDDYGRIDARPKLLASKLFPLKDIRPSNVEDALRALASAELVTLYEVGGKPFLQIDTWDKHQTVRNKKSKYPGPEKLKSIESNCKQLKSIECNCKQLNANVPVIQSNPIQYEYESESETNPNSLFGRFWSAYPRKEAVADAREAFSKIDVSEDLLEIMLRAIDKAKKSAQWKKDHGAFIPLPAKWLKGERWKDEIPQNRGVSDRSGFHNLEERDEDPDEIALEMMRSHLNQ